MNTRLHILLLLAFLFAITLPLQGQILTFEFAGLAGNETTAPSTSNAAGVDPSTISRGSGVSANANADRFNSTGWTQGAVIDVNDYVEFTITPQSGYDVSISSIQFYHQRSGTGPHEFALRSSLDAYASDIGSGNPFDNGDVTTTQNNTVTTSGVTGLQNFTAAVTFRLYGYVAEAAGGSWGPGDHPSGDDIIVNGTVNSSCTPPGSQASAFSATNITSSSMDVNWVRGTGDNVLVLARSGSAVNASPSSGTSYTADAAFGSGNQIGTGNYVVYNGPGNSVTVTGLSTSTAYHYAIFEYNNMDVCYLTPGLTGNATTSAPTALYFRSKQSGSWADASTWESSADGNTWADATSAPNSSLDLTITIQSPDEVNIPDDATIDQVVVDEGATLKFDNIADLTINNGTGVDLDINGTLHDNATAVNTASFSTGAKWRQGANSTFLKTNDSGSSVYRDAYEGTISTIPATAHWIIRDVEVTLPSVGGMNYPNLTIENNTGADLTLGFSGSSGFPTIKGNFDVGGSGSGNIIFDNLNTNATPCLILGNVIVKSGSLLDNTDGTTDGTGFEVQGNITAEGDLNLTGGTGARGTLRFSGGNAQTVTGAGFIDINNLTVNKSGNQVTFNDLAEEVWVYTQLAMTSRNIVLNDEVLELRSPGTLSGGSASSFIQTNGTGTFSRTVGASAAAFPIGNSAYNPCTLTNTGTSDYFSARVADDVLADGTTGAPLMANVVDRTWLLVEDEPGGTTASLTVQWNTAEELGGFTRALCYVSHHDGTGWGDDTPAAASNPSAGIYTRTRTGLTSFSPFAVASSGELPIELATLTAHAQKRDILLRWETASERDNAYFAIERSNDGNTFREIGQQPSMGNSRSPQTYTYTDFSPAKGANYYRLRQVDTDGRYAYSPVVTAVMEESFVRLSPSAATDVLRLTASEPTEETHTWQVFDTAGRLLQSGIWEAESVQHEVSVSDLPQGHYVLRLTAGQQSPVVLRFQKM